MFASEQALWDLHGRLSQALEDGGSGAREIDTEARAVMDEYLSTTEGKVEACAAFLRRLDLEVEHLTRESARMTRLLKLAQDMRERFRGYAVTSLSGRPRTLVRGFAGTRIFISSGRQRVRWRDGAKLPDDCVVFRSPPREVKIRRLQERLTAGEAIEGAWLEPAPSTLQVR
jgi:hypothetical protein